MAVSASSGSEAGSLGHPWHHRRPRSPSSFNLCHPWLPWGPHRRRSPQNLERVTAAVSCAPLTSHVLRFRAGQRRRPREDGHQLGRQGHHLSPYTYTLRFRHRRDIGGQTYKIVSRGSTRKQ